MSEWSKVEPKHVLFVLTLFLIFNSFDAFYTLHVMDKYNVAEQNSVVVTLMNNGYFLLIKVGIPLTMGLFLFTKLKKFNEKQLIQTFAIGKLGVLFYTEVNVLNILFIYHYFGSV